jgi:hypothetical protein
MGEICTGEYSVEVDKIHCMRTKHEESVETMRQIKQALD